MDNYSTNYPDARASREETLSLMTSLHQSHLNELEQQKFSQKSPDILAHSGDLFSSSSADPVFVPRQEGRSSSFRPAPSLTPFSNTLNPGLQLYESVERKARGGIDNVDNWRRTDREVPDASSRKGRVSVDNIT